MSQDSKMGLGKETVEKATNWEMKKFLCIFSSGEFLPRKLNQKKGNIPVFGGKNSWD